MTSHLGKVFACFLVTVSVLGCTKQNWLAKIYVFKAEESFSKAHALRTRKGEVSHEQRLKSYRQACDFFSQAYEIDSRAFTLNRIGEAIEACLWVEDFKGEQNFRRFEEAYIQAHPDEAKYGDAGAYLALEA